MQSVSNSTAAAFDPIDQWQLISECSSQRLWKIIVSLPVLTTIGASWPTVGLDSAVCDSGQILLFQCFICLPTRQGNVFASWGILSTQLAFGTSISYILKAPLFPSCWGFFFGHGSGETVTSTGLLWGGCYQCLSALLGKEVEGRPWRRGHKNTKLPEAGMPDISVA